MTDNRSHAMQFLLEQQAQAEFERLKVTMERLFALGARARIATDGLGWPEDFSIERLATTPQVDEIRRQKVLAAA